MVPDGNRALADLPQDDEAFAGSTEALAHWFQEGSAQKSHGGPHRAGSGAAHGLLSEA